MTIIEKGKFISFEGIEGSGKTTQFLLIEEYFKREGLPFIITREPGGTDFGRQVRSILLDERGPDRTPIAELLLYLADRYQDLKQVIEPNLNRGKHVLCDRYHDATVAYQGYARGISLDLINALASALNLIQPDLTILLDSDVTTGLSRARQRNMQVSSKDGRFEAEAVEFHLRVREGYLKLARQNPNRIKVIASEGSVQEVHEKIKNLIKSALGGA